MTTSAKDRFRPAGDTGFEPEIWPFLRAMADRTRAAAPWDGEVGWRLDASGRLAETPDLADAWARWAPAQGWTVGEHLPEYPRTLLELYLPLCEPDPDHSFVIGHLGQSLDGCIATRSGDSACVTGRGNILHLHRLRALCDAILVGAGTVAADDPRLTTRLVKGTSPLRVVLDPQRRLGAGLGLFNDGAAPTLVVCAAGSGQERRVGEAEVLEVPAETGGLDLEWLLVSLRTRGCRRVMVEGGGITVSRFLNAGLLDRLHIAVSPVIIGDGRPGLQLPTAKSMSDARRPRHRVFRMGDDILFDCEPAHRHEPGASGDGEVLGRID